MGNKSDAISQKRARNKGYYASDLSECKYKYGSAWWHAWMDGWRANKSHLTKRAADPVSHQEVVCRTFRQ